MARLTTLNGYLALLVRRKWWIIVPFLALSAFSVLFARVIPDAYISDTMIMIQPREIPTDFVGDLISGSTDQRLSSIEQTILSRTNLLKICSEFENSMDQYHGLNNEAKVAKLKSQILIRFPTEGSGGSYMPVTHIRISFRDNNPELAQKIAGRLTSLFIEQDARTRESRVFGTTQFLKTQLGKVEKELKQSEESLNILKERYRNQMPDQLDTNLRALDRLQRELTATIEALDRSISNQMALERQISETPSEIVQESSLNVESAKAPVTNPLVEEYKKKELEYKQLATRVTERHPDLQRVKAELEGLREEISPEDLEVLDAPILKPPSPDIEPNPAYQKLTAQLQQIKTEIEIRQRRKKQIEEEMARYNQRVENKPRVEQEIAALWRENEDLRQQHDDIKSKLEQAKMAESLESLQKGAQFVVVDPANYPLEPAPPSRLAIMLTGFAVSLFAGFALAFLVDLSSKKVFTEFELEKLLKAPVLAEIPAIVTVNDLRRARRMRFLQVSLFLVFAGIYIAGLYYLYLKQSILLNLLAPLIERIRG